MARLGCGFAWLDNWAHDSFLEACTFVETIGKRQGLNIACGEEFFYRNGYVDAVRPETLAAPMKNNGYGQNMLHLLKDNIHDPLEGE